MKRTWIAVALIAAGLATHPLLVAAQGSAAALAARSSSERGVTVTVKPGSLAQDAKTWDFEIVLDTHSQDLGDDLPKAALLVDSDGRQYTPTAWDGAAPGGHHRKGVLRFKPVSPPPQAIELQIRRPGEASPRVFRWQLR
jgi:hypothetical protein